MREEIQKRWVDALRSGEYKQGRFRLRAKVGNEVLDCCLGVLCDLYVKEHPEAHWENEDDAYTYLYVPGASFANYVPPTPVLEWAGLDVRDGCVNLPERLMFKVDKEGGVTHRVTSLTEANDIAGKSFDEIADLIEQAGPEL